MPNVARFTEQAEALRELLTTAPPDEDQQKDLGFLLIVGELFTLVVYGQLILEQAQLDGVDTDVVDQVFDVFVRDFSASAVTLHGQASASEAQREWALGAVRAPAGDDDRFAARVGPGGGAVGRLRDAALARARGAITSG